MPNKWSKQDSGQVLVVQPWAELRPLQALKKIQLDQTAKIQDNELRVFPRVILSTCACVWLLLLLPGGRTTAKGIKESVLHAGGQDRSPMTASICSAEVSLSNWASARVPVLSWPCTFTFLQRRVTAKTNLCCRGRSQHVGVWKKERKKRKKVETQSWVIIFQHFSGQHVLIRDFLLRKAHLWRLSLDGAMISLTDLNMQSWCVGRSESLPKWWRWKNK